MEANTLSAENEGEMIPVQRLVRVQRKLAELSSLPTKLPVLNCVGRHTEEPGNEVPSRVRCVESVVWIKIGIESARPVLAD